MKNILIAAGGTGGHLFPVLAVVESLKNMLPEVNFEFFGRKDKIEGRIVPQLGYKLHETNFKGIVNFYSFNTLKMPFQLCSATLSMCNIIRKNKIDAVICAGAYLSLPPGIAAHLTDTKLILMESNVNPGKAINFLANKADLIFTSFAETQNFFKPNIYNKLKCYGNPVRQEIIKKQNKKEAVEKFKLNPKKPVVLVFGGSLGAKSINDAVLKNLEKFEKSNYQIIWQTGDIHQFNIDKLPQNIVVANFIDDMATAYSAADLVVSRSGATTVAELCVAGKPSILVPLPSASNNEQYHNAKVLQDNDSAILIKNSEIEGTLYNLIENLLNNTEKLQFMSNQALKLAHPNASYRIATEIIKIF